MCEKFGKLPSEILNEPSQPLMTIWKLMGEFEQYRHKRREFEANVNRKKK